MRFFTSRKSAERAARRSEVATSGTVEGSRAVCRGIGVSGADRRESDTAVDHRHASGSRALSLDAVRISPDEIGRPASEISARISRRGARLMHAVPFAEIEALAFAKAECVEPDAADIPHVAALDRNFRDTAYWLAAAVLVRNGERRRKRAARKIADVAARCLGKELDAHGAFAALAALDLLDHVGAVDAADVVKGRSRETRDAITVLRRTAAAGAGEQSKSPLALQLVGGNGDLLPFLGLHFSLAPAGDEALAGASTTESASASDSDSSSASASEHSGYEYDAEAGFWEIAGIVASPPDAEPHPVYSSFGRTRVVWPRPRRAPGGIFAHLVGGRVDGGRFRGDTLIAALVLSKGEAGRQ